MILFHWLGILGRNLLLAKWAEDDRRRTEEWDRQIAMSYDECASHLRLINDAYESAKASGQPLVVYGRTEQAIRTTEDFAERLPWNDYSLDPNWIGMYRGLRVIRRSIPPAPLPPDDPPGYIPLLR